MKKIFTYIIIIFTIHCLAGTKEYIVGSGSEFRFTDTSKQNVALSIYISESSFSKLGVEYFFNANAVFSNIQVWQQFTMGIKENGLSIDAGYIQSLEMKLPEIMTPEFLNNNSDGVKIDDFFFSKNSELDKFKIAIEQIEVPAGNLLATHYRKINGDQTVDFWISDKAGAIGLAKLISKGIKNQDHDYKIELVSLLKNVKPKINPKTAISLTEKGRMFLGKKK